jgi:pimeloyl-ACP methyl ester carboxylesterase
MQLVFKIFFALMFVVSFDFANAFEMKIYKTVTLPSFPQIKVLIYRSSGSKGPGILFIHGNSSSSRAFIQQQMSLFGSKYRLYFLDLPGFGRAGKVKSTLKFPVDQNGVPVGFPEYQAGLVEAIIRVANDPAINAKVLVGWSLGGDLALLAYGTGALPNVKGIMMFGTAPVGANAPAVAPFLKPNVPGLPFNLSILASFGLAFDLSGAPPLGFDFLGQFTDPVPEYAPAPISNSRNIGKAYIKAFFNRAHRASGNVPGFFYEDGFRRADARARGSIGVVSFGLLPPGQLPDELEVLKSLRVPIAVIHGKEDAFVNPNYLVALKQNQFLPTLWKNKIIMVEGVGHAVQYESPKAFNSLLTQFVNGL